ISSIPNEEFNDLVKEFTEIEVNQFEYAQIIKNIKKAPVEERTRLNDDHFEAPLNLDYSIGKREIYALKPFFDTFDKVRLSSQEVAAMDRQLLHEATHVFGIGVQDDKVSFELSKMLLKRLRVPINSTWRDYGCGA